MVSLSAAFYLGIDFSFLPKPNHRNPVSCWEGTERAETLALHSLWVLIKAGELHFSRHLGDFLCIDIGYRLNIPDPKTWKNSAV